MEGKCAEGCQCEEAVWEKLAAYEDTGLMPEEIVVLQASFEELKKEAVPLMQAKTEGRMVVLPCKMGDTIYMPVGRWNTITGYEEDKCDGFHIAQDGILQIKAQCYTGNHGTYGVPGKTVFLTREEAEAALAQMSKDVEVT